MLRSGVQPLAVRNLNERPLVSEFRRRQGVRTGGTRSSPGRRNAIEGAAPRSGPIDGSDER